MLREGDSAPEFTAPVVTPETAAEAERGSYTGDHVEAFSLSDALAEGPVVLAFFPGVYSRTCTQELCELRDWRADLTDLEAPVYGVSVDTPWSQLAFVDEYDLNYPLLSGFNSDLVADYGLESGSGVLRGIAKRAVVVVAPDGTVAYTWSADEPLTFPDVDEIESVLDGLD